MNTNICIVYHWQAYTYIHDYIHIHKYIHIHEYIHVYCIPLASRSSQTRLNILFSFLFLQHWLKLESRRDSGWQIHYMYICVYTCIYVHMYIYTHIHVHIYVNIYIHIKLWLKSAGCGTEIGRSTVFTYIYIYTYVYLYIPTH